MKLRRILASFSRLSSSHCPSRQIFTSSSQRDKLLPGNHIKWASLGSVRNSRFATGFTPLRRGNGYITMFAQAVEMPHMVFTCLEDYKARGTQAAPYLTTTFYTELSETKDLVFIRGDVVFTSKLTDEEAKWIMETAQLFLLERISVQATRAVQ